MNKKGCLWKLSLFYFILFTESSRSLSVVKRSTIVCISPLLDEVTGISKIKAHRTLLGSFTTINNCLNQTWRNGFRTDFDNIFKEKIFTLSDFAFSSLIDLKLVSDWALKIALGKSSFNNFCINFQLVYPNRSETVTQHYYLPLQHAILFFIF